MPVLFLLLLLLLLLPASLVHVTKGATQCGRYCCCCCCLLLLLPLQLRAACEHPQLQFKLVASESVFQMIGTFSLDGCFVAAAVASAPAAASAAAAAAV